MSYERNNWTQHSIRGSLQTDGPARRVVARRVAVYMQGKVFFRSTRCVPCIIHATHGQLLPSGLHPWILGVIDEAHCSIGPPVLA